MAGAVHGLEAVLGVVELHGRIHVFGVVALVAADLPELAAHDVRGEDHIVTAADTFFAHPVFHGLADEAALGVPEDEAGAGDLLDAEEVELLAEHAMVARLDLFQMLEVSFEVLGVEEGGAVDALELLVLLVAEPVGAGDGGDLEGLDAAGGGDVRAAAEVGEVAVFVEGDLIAGFGEALDEVDLHELALRGVVGEALFAGFVHADEGLVAGDDLGHAGFDGGEVGFGERGVAVDVVEEAVVGGGAVAEFGLGKELEDGGGHDVRGGVAKDFERGFVGVLEEPEGHIFFEWRGEVDDARAVLAGAALYIASSEVGDSAVVVCWCRWGRCQRRDARDDDGGGKPRGDAGGDVEGGGSARDFALGAVGKLDSDLLCAHALQDTSSRG